MAAKKPAKGDDPQVSAFRSSVANGLRAIGTGYGEATDWNAVTVDKGTIYPIESLYSAGSAYRAATAKIPLVNKTAGIFSVIGFLGSFQGMIAGSLLRAPGELAKDVTSSLADKIDGGKSFDGNVGLFTVEEPDTEGPATS
jgi:hypothetical protein